MILWYPIMSFHCSLLHAHEELQPTGKAHIGEVLGELPPIGESKGRVWWVILRKKEKQRLRWTGHNFPSPSPCTTVREQVDKVKPRRKGGVGGKLFQDLFFISYYPSLIWLVITSGNFPESLPVLILTHEPFPTFSLPCPVEEWQNGFGGTLSSQGQPTPSASEVHPYYES